jgi:hypothetical protein
LILFDFIYCCSQGKATGGPLGRQNHAFILFYFMLCFVLFDLFDLFDFVYFIFLRLLPGEGSRWPAGQKALPFILFYFINF